MCLYLIFTFPLPLFLYLITQARVEISECIIDSVAGFGVWVKHGGRVGVKNTTFLRAGSNFL